MAERPKVLRSLRAIDALALATTAAALAVSPAQAAVNVVATGYADVSIDGSLFAFHRPGGIGELRSPAGTQPLPGNHPAVGGGRVAWIEGATVVVQGVATISAPGADALSVSTNWVAWRSGQALHAAPLDPAQGFVSRPVVTGVVGKPVLGGNLLVFELDGRIEAFDLATGQRTLLRRETEAELRGPSVNGFRLTYVRATYKRQQVLTGLLVPRKVSSDRALYGTTPTSRRDAGHEKGRFPAKGHINKPLWARPPEGVHDTLTTTASALDAVYVTRVRQLRGATAKADVLRIDL
jgi:hypothetical protein